MKFKSTTGPNFCYSSKIFFNDTCKLTKPRIFKVLKKKTSLLSSIESLSKSLSVFGFFNLSYTMIYNNNKRYLLASSTSPFQINSNLSPSSNLSNHMSHNRIHDPESISQKALNTWNVGRHLGLVVDNQKNVALSLFAEQIVE